MYENDSFVIDMELFVSVAANFCRRPLLFKFLNVNFLKTAMLLFANFGNHLILNM